MHSAQATYAEDADGDQEPAILSYTQFRNHLGLLDWRRRRAEYEQQASTVAPARHLPGQVRPRPGASNAA